MKIEEIIELFNNGIDCSQIVTGEFSKELGLDLDILRKMASSFGGGMQCGETCGAFTGALMIIGLQYGNSLEGDFEQKSIVQEKSALFKDEFLKKYPSCICKELLGYNIGEPEGREKIMEKGLLENYCPYIVKNSIEILEKII